MRTASAVNDRAPPSLGSSDGPLVNGPWLRVSADSTASISDFYAACAFVPIPSHTPTPSPSRECNPQTLSTLEDRAQADARLALSRLASIAVVHTWRSYRTSS